MLKMLRRVAGEKRAASGLYRVIAEASRKPVFFCDWGVADTFDGRFDLLVLHAWLVMDALRSAELEDLEQRLIQAVFAGFEEGLRDQGAGDMSIGRRSKAMTSAMFGRVASYRAAGDEDAMTEALIRNLYRGADDKRDCARAVAHYITQSRKSLATSDLVGGSAAFGAATNGD